MMIDRLGTYRSKNADHPLTLVNKSGKVSCCQWNVESSKLGFDSHRLPLILFGDEVEKKSIVRILSIIDREITLF